MDISYERAFETKRWGKVTFTMSLAPPTIAILLFVSKVLSKSAWWPYATTFVFGCISAASIYLGFIWLKAPKKVSLNSNLALRIQDAAKSIWGITDDDFSLSWRTDVCERVQEFLNRRDVDSTQRAITSIARFSSAKPQWYAKQSWGDHLKRLAQVNGFKTDGFPS